MRGEKVKMSRARLSHRRGHRRAGRRVECILNCAPGVEGGGGSTRGRNPYSFIHHSLYLPNLSHLADHQVGAGLLGSLSNEDGDAEDNAW